MSEVRLEGYKLEGAVGGGAVSSLYRATQEATGREVVLKALKASIPSTSSFAAQLEREARILAEMSHPNVVLLIDFKKADHGAGRTFLVLERVDGFSLRELLRRKRALRVDVACSIACEVLSGLEHAHARGVVHRDIKPENILLAKRGDVKIVDFGIAQRDKLPSANEPLVMEERGESLRKEAFGAPAYMSPEQVLGEHVDARSDLYSLGVVLYRMLSGVRPDADLHAKAGEERRQDASRQRRDAPVPLSDRTKELPRGLTHVVMRLLEKRPDDRYKDAAVVRELLEPYARGPSKEAHARLIRRSLIEAALIKDDGRRSEERTVQSATERPWVSFGVFAAIGLAFCLAGGVIQATSQKEQRLLATGARALPLAPPESGGLRVLAMPWAEVWVDGQRVEVTPFARSVPLASGTHFVTLKHPDAPEEKRTVEITAGETVQLDVTMHLSDEPKK
jgi:serine/threonine-protein kinase